MQELIDRLEKATGPDKQLDASIFFAVTGIPAHSKTPGYSGGTVSRRMQGLPAYTASIDAALTLVPAGDWQVHFTIHAESETFCFLHSNKLVQQFHSPGAIELEKRKPTAIAICIAALKARSALLAKDQA
jgi:hypothetical protein